MPDAIQLLRNAKLQSPLELDGHGFTEDGVPVGGVGLHAATHEDGGSDEIEVSQAQVTGLAGALTAKVPTATFTTHLNDVANPHTVTKTQVNLGNADNTSDVNKPISSATQTALDGKAAVAEPIAATHNARTDNPHAVTKTQVGLANVTNDAQIPLAQKGTANGVAELDGSGFVPSAQLPSFVDDVIEVANFAALPATGVTQKIYVTLDDNKTFRWSGSIYVEISSSLALGETSSTAYRGDRGKTAYDHSQLTSGNPHAVTKAEVGLGSANNTSDADKPVSTAGQAALDLKSNLDDSRFTDARTPTDHAASHAFGGTDAITPHVEQTNGDSNVTVTAGVTVLRQTVALSTVRTGTLPPTSAYANGATFSFVDKYSDFAVDGRMEWIPASGDTVNGASSYVGNAGAGVKIFEKSGTNWIDLPTLHYAAWVETVNNLAITVSSAVDTVNNFDSRLVAVEPSIIALAGGTALTRGRKYFDTLIADRTLTHAGTAIPGQITSLNLNVTDGPWTLNFWTSYRLGETDSITSLVLSNGRHELSWRYDGTNYILSDTAIEMTVTPTTLSGNVNDYNPTGLAYASVLRIDGGASDRIITGIDASTFGDGRVLLLINIGTTNKLSLPSEDTGSTAANRILGPGTIELGPNTAIALRRDGVSSRFRPFSRALSNTGVTAGAYGSANAIPVTTFDAQGRATAASTVAIDSHSGTISAPTTTNPLALTWTSKHLTVYAGATMEFDLPVAADYTDRTLLVYNTGAFTLTFDPNESEVIVRAGVLQTGGVSMTLSSGAGNLVTFISDGAKWITLGYIGTLAVGS